MWDVPGEPVDCERFEPFEPLEVLDHYDGPRIFTFENLRGDYYLASWCDGDDGLDRYLVVPSNTSMRDKLTRGLTTVRGALDQPWLWVLDRVHADSSSRAWLTAFEQLPPAVLPEPGTMLWPSLEPLLSVRALGTQIGEGTTPASVIRDTIDAAEKALKVLIDYALEHVQLTDRPAKSFRELYDLPAIGLAFRSFEISFRPTIDGSQVSFEEIQGEEDLKASKIYDQIARLLEKGLKSLDARSASLESVGDTPEESRAILRAIERLAPPASGYIHAIELRGELIGNASIGQRPVRLERGLRATLKRALRRLSGEQIEYRDLTGLIREFDKDRSTFELRDIEEDGRTTHRFGYESAFEEDIIEACQADKRVRIIAFKEPSEKQFYVVAIIDLDP